MPGTLPLPARASRGLDSEAPRRGGVARWRGAVPFTARLRVVEPASAEPRGRDSRLRRVAFVDATMRTEARPQPSATSNQRAVRARQPHRRHRPGRPPGAALESAPHGPAAPPTSPAAARAAWRPARRRGGNGLHEIVEDDQGSATFLAAGATAHNCPCEDSGRRRAARAARSLRLVRTSWATRDLVERASDLACPRSWREVSVLVVLFTGYAVYGGLVVGAGCAAVRLVAQCVDPAPVW